ncbi:acetylglutamate kinase [Myroides odoratimimus]|uniref:Acetylglutamate kinase n=3 Tax=Myroides odoratimimus TaxID=76832 RepID=A0A0S7E701_9FLAO|nr:MULTISPECIES: acetylglutamate kinase [Myroides]AJA68258.1 N-acetylglutamate kinase [Myroides sp. A21]ALU25557.1 acetylglutamate kinase [Myroides odoratimimus]APA91582.1 acetylglutamate kinase [Myroides sp. ZB35]EHO10894.1 acetylglutamate kinase [Myroides odoratimimus CCUG 10230]EHO15470.1 acetylglutamate kinase [Myroides odoratimimus CIP 101113]
MQSLTVIKIGGNIVDDESALNAFLDIYARIEGPKVLVHGGGKLATRMAAQLGIETQMVNGRRITDEAMLPIAVMVYAGLINKQITAQLQARGCDAMGISGADAKLIQSHKRPIEPIDYGYVGDFEASDVNVVRLQQLLEIGISPVFSAITADKEGQLLNTNADTIASNIAVALATKYKVALVYCFERKGVLQDINDENSVINTINQENFTQLKQQGVIADGMLPKIENALAAVNQGVDKVCIKKAEDLLDIKAGTTIQL